MALSALIIITLACIGWSLWIRRVTWHCRWEVAATLNIALQGLAVLLMSPMAANTLGVGLHDLDSLASRHRAGGGQDHSIVRKDAARSAAPAMLCHMNQCRLRELGRAHPGSIRRCRLCHVQSLATRKH